MSYVLIVVVCKYQFNPIPRTGIIMVSKKKWESFSSLYELHHVWRVYQTYWMKTTWLGFGKHTSESPLEPVSIAIKRF